MSLIPLVHLDLRISPRIFEKIRNDPLMSFRGLIHEKNRKKKSRDTVPFNLVRCTKSLRVLFLHRRPPSWTTLVLYSRAVFIFNEPASKFNELLNLVLLRVLILVRMRSSLVVRRSDCQCTSCNCPGFDPSIRRHRGI